MSALKRRIRNGICLILAVFLLVLASCTQTPAAPQDIPLPQESVAQAVEYGTFTLRSLNIGEADAHLLLLPDGSAALIDTGRKKHFAELDAALSAAGVTELSALILTHGHKDHVGGLEKLAEKYAIKTIYTAVLAQSNFSAKKLERIRESGAESVALAYGDIFHLGGVDFRVLAPHTATDDENNCSLVLLVQHGNVRFLFMGDAKEEVEAELLSLRLDLAAHVLKTGHHGKNDATTSAFLKTVSPKYAILTGCEEDEEGDSPGQQTIARLEKSGAELFIMRKDFLAAEFVSDGDSVAANIINEW